MLPSLTPLDVPPLTSETAGELEPLVLEGPGAGAPEVLLYVAAGEKKMKSKNYECQRNKY